MAYLSQSSGNYQFQSLQNIIDYFMLTYVGEDKIIKRIKKYEVSFHAHRALSELSFDTFKSVKSQEITLPPSLTIDLPVDYVNYTKLSYSDNAGIEHIIYPTSKTSNPFSILQDADGNYQITELVTFTAGSNTATISSVNTDIKFGMEINSAYFQGTITGISFSTTTTTLNLSGNASSSGEIRTVIAEGQILQKNQGISETINCTIPANTNTITSTSASSIKVGMSVFHSNIGTGATVLSVNNNNIVIDDTSNNSAELTDVAVTFVETIYDSNTFTNYKSHDPAENNINDYQDYENNVYWPNEGERYGLDPQHAQVNGSFYIDDNRGKIYFSSNLSGQNIILKYISDSLGTDGEMRVHKFAEEAMYKSLMYSIMCVSSNIPEYQVRRLKKEKFAAVRKAKLRLSNIKLEEITQILRGKSKQIKH